MPTYDYQCRSCGRTTEVIHSMLEDGPTTCEICGGQLRRVIYPSGIIFRGAGFYKNDSRSSGSSDSSSRSAPSKEPSKDGSSKDGSSKEPRAASGKEAPSSSTSTSESGSGGGSSASGSAKSAEPG